MGLFHRKMKMVAADGTCVQWESVHEVDCAGVVSDARSFLSPLGVGQVAAPVVPVGGSFEAGECCACPPAAAGATYTSSSGIKNVGNDFRVTTTAWAGQGDINTCGQLLSLDANGDLRQREEKGSVNALVGANIAAPAVGVLLNGPTALIVNPLCGPMNVSRDGSVGGEFLIGMNGTGTANMTWFGYFNGALYSAMAEVMQYPSVGMAMDWRKTREFSRPTINSVLAGGATDSSTPGFSYTTAHTGAGYGFMASVNFMMTVIATSQ